MDCFCSSAGFSFDLSPLTKKDGYKVETEKYDFYINVCAPLSLGSCQPGSGACQVSKRQATACGYGFSLGVSGSRCLSQDQACSLQTSGLHSEPSGTGKMQPAHQRMLGV